MTAMRASQAFIYQPSATFPAFLRGAREAAGLSIRQTAAAIGISAAWLSRLETGGSARQPSIDRLRRMAELYNVELHGMIGEAGVVEAAALLNSILQGQGFISRGQGDPA